MGDSVKGFSFGDLRFDWLTVLKGNTQLPLSQFERQILEYIVIRRPSVVAAEAIYRHIRGREPSEYDMCSFWTTLYNLRKKLKKAKTVVTIVTNQTGHSRRVYSAGLLMQAAE